MEVRRSALGRKLASCVMSVVLAAGLVPAPALAEAANELRGLVVVEESAPGDAISLGEDPGDAASTDEGTAQQEEGPIELGEPNVPGEPDTPVEPEASGEPPASGMPAFAAQKTVGGVTVSVAAEEGTFPAGAELSVRRATKEQRRAASEAVADARAEGQHVAASYSFDIKVTDPATGGELQPAEGKLVSVSFSLAQVADENLTTSVYHVTEGESAGGLSAEPLDVTTTAAPGADGEATATVEADGFSIYTVEFTYGELQYVLPGDSSVPMLEVLATLGLVGEPEAVEVSDESLFYASDETGEWVVTAHRAFTTTEWMRVTIGGVAYEVVVTDAVFPSGSGTESNPYKIESAANWKAFCSVVNAENAEYGDKHYRLEADISVNGDPSLNKSLFAGDHKSNPFRGTFDGGGHTLTYNFTSTIDGTAPFRYIDHATIKDLNVAGLIGITGKRCAAGIASYVVGTSNSYILSCTVSSTILSSLSGSGWHGGLVGEVAENAGILIQDCVFHGEIVGTAEYPCGGFVGGNYGSATITNSLFDPVKVTVTGLLYSFCYNRSGISLNNVYRTFVGMYSYQNQGKRAYSEPPEMPITKKVTSFSTGTYYVEGDATITGVKSSYGWTGQEIPLPNAAVKFDGLPLNSSADYDLVFKDANGNQVNKLAEVGDYTVTATGRGVYAGSLSKAFTVVKGDGTLAHPYTIGSKEEWNDFAERVNNGDSYSGKYWALTDDITVDRMVGYKDSKNTRSFDGIFLGNHHTLTVDLAGEEAYIAPFRFASGATIRDLAVAGRVSVSSGSLQAACLVGRSSGNTTIAGCHVTATLESTNSGWTYCGGLVGENEGVLALEGCSFGGDLLGSGATRCGGFLGWNQNATATLTDCLFAPRQLTMSAEESGTFVTSVAKGAMTLDRVYYVTPLGKPQGAKVSAEAPDGVCREVVGADGARFYGEACVVSGTDACYPLAGVPVHPEPVVKDGDDTLVRDVDYTLDWDEAGAAEGAFTLIVRGKGNYVGVCAVGYTVSDSTTTFGGRCFLTDTDDEGEYIVIATAQDLRNLAAAVNDGNHGLGLRFVQTADIDLGGETFKTIGIDRDISNGYGFSGTYDGGHHCVSGLKAEGRYEAGLFGLVGGSGAVRNVRLIEPQVTNLSSNGNLYSGSVVGLLMGTVEGCAAINPTVEGGTYKGAVYGGSLNGSSCAHSYYYGGNQGCNGTRAYKVTLGSGLAVKTGYDGDGTDAHGFRVGDGAHAGYYTSAGETVTLAPAVGGYSIMSAWYTPSGGTRTRIPESDGAFSFAMPEGDVTVSATVASDTEPLVVYEDGTEYTINTVEGWNEFCELLESSDKGFFTGKTVRLGADVGTAEAPVTRMAGSDGHDFTGTFDGRGHALTVSYGTAEEPVAEDAAAPFRNVEGGGVIRNLRVGGDIHASGKYAGGIVGAQYGGVTIEDCCVSATIHSHAAGDGSHGGLVGLSGNRDDSELAVTGCVFDGKILAEDTAPTTGCSGFVGVNDGSGTVAIADSLYAPAALADGETEPVGGCATFARDGSAGENCYYTRSLGTAQGRAANAVTLGERVTIADEPARSYEANGVTIYNGDNGEGALLRNGTLYAVEGFRVTLGHEEWDRHEFERYEASVGTLEDSILTVPNANVEVTARYIELPAVDYLDSAGNAKNVTVYKRLKGDTRVLSGWWVVDGGVEVSHRLEVEGEAHLVLLNGASLTSHGGIRANEGNALTVYAQSADDAAMGRLTVDGVAERSAGIGGNTREGGGVLTVNGGAITVIGGKFAAGIGGGNRGSGGTITVNGGVVDATGGKDSGGIGDGVNCSPSAGVVTVNGGVVRANNGIFGKNITLGWAKATDSIYANGYGSQVYVAEGRKFVTNDDPPATITSGKVLDRDRINGKTLTPANVTIDGDMRYGTVTADKYYAEQGDTVTLTVKPYEGCAIVAVSYNDGEERSLDPVGGVYAFKKPDADVAVTATFAPDPTNFTDDADGAYTIHTAAGWGLFCDLLNDGETFEGKTVRLGADVGTADAPVTRMAGDADHRFRGILSGQGHTLTVRYGSDDKPVSDDNAAPLCAVDSGCRIEGLHVAGDIYTSMQFAGGIVGSQYGEVTISDCRVSATIHGSISGDGTHGGLVGLGCNGSGSSLGITGCLFDGRMLAEGSGGTTNCGGFVGWRKAEGTLTIKDSLYAPTALADGEREATSGSATFVRNASNGSVTNCYYARALGATEKQGKQLHAISAVAGVTVTPSGTATEYGVSGITAYENNRGLRCGGAFYAGEGDAVGLTLGYVGTVPEGCSVVYVPSAGTLGGTDNPHTLTMPDGDVTIGTVVGHKVTVSGEISGGSVTPDKPIAAEGDTVTLTVTLTDGDNCRLGSLRATYGDGQELELTQGTGEDVNKWTFRMPDADVVATATFVKDLVVDGDTYTINTAAGWDAFCDLLANNDKGFFTGKTVKLGADIGTAEDPVTRMAGSDGHDFTGTFDGQGYTLTVRYGSADAPEDANNAAPFRNVADGCTIEGLHVCGDVYTSKKFAGGLVGTQYGEVTIKNCRVSTVIHSYTGGDGTHGGIVGLNDNVVDNPELTIEGCLFDGKILTEGANPTTNCGGFVGYANKKVSITNSLYAPAALGTGEVEPLSGSSTFLRNASGTYPTITYCYYARSLGKTDMQGSLAHTIGGGAGVTIAPVGTATEYDVSGITAYLEKVSTSYSYESYVCLKCGGTLYAGKDGKVFLGLEHQAPEGYSGFTGYSASAGKLENLSSRYKLTMPDEDVTISANFSPDPAHFSQDGDTYTIRTAAGWGVFCDLVNGGETFSGKTVKLGADIEVTRMAGHDNGDNDNRPFCGTFDGQGKTLTLNYGGDVKYIAPFPRASGNASFRNLTVSGTINSTSSNAAGLVGHLYGTVTIEHCASNVGITSKGDAGGFVGLCEHTVSFLDCVSSAVIHSDGGNNGGFVGFSRASGYEIHFTGCIFNGKLLQKDGSGDSNGCFIGWTGSNKTVTILDSLCAPADPANGETMADSKSATFARGWNATTTATNSYYTAALGTSQGKQAHAITAGDHATIDFGSAKAAYNVSGISAYDTGIAYGGTFYAGKDEAVNLRLGHGDAPEGYTHFVRYDAGMGTLAGTNNPYTLTMPDEDVAVSAVYGYAVNVGGGITGGTVTSDVAVAAPGDTVSLTVTPNAGYAMTSLVVTYSSGGESATVETTPGLGGDSGKHSFTMPAGTVTVTATFEKGYNYIDYVDGKAVTKCLVEGRDQYTVIYRSWLQENTALSGWYVIVDVDANTYNLLEVSGDVHLILCDGKALNACGGITVHDGSSLTIYAQSGGAGRLWAGDGETNKDSAGIGGGKITINGGTVEASGGNALSAGSGGGAGISGTLTVNGGNVTATGKGSGAGISNDVTVNFSSVGDSLTASSYNGTMTVAKGKVVTYSDGALYAGTLSDEEREAIAGKKLVLSDAAHAIDVDVKGQGTVTPSAKAALPDAPVTLDVSPAEGSVFVEGSLHATYVSSGETVDVQLSGAGEGRYTFQMPDANVTVSATFRRALSVTFAAGEGASGEMAPATVVCGEEYELPACGFTAPEGKAFRAWSVVVGDAEAVDKAPGEKVEVTADVTATAMWAASEPAFRSTAMILSGQIGVNFYADLSMLAEDQRAAVTVEFGVGGRTLTDSYDPGCMNGARTYYGFTCPISSAQMAETITATLRYGDGGTATASTSVKEYAAYIVGNPDAFGEKAVALAEAIADYGHYMTPFIKAYGTVADADTAIECYTEYTQDQIDAAKDAVAQTPVQKLDVEGILAGATYKLVLGSETTIKLYFRAAEGHAIDDAGQIAVTDRDGAALKKAEVMKEGDRWCVRIPSINAAQLADRYTVTVTDGGGSGATATIGLSALSYAHTVMTSAQFDGENRTMTDCAMASLYYYYSATRDYVG